MTVRSKKILFKVQKKRLENNAGESGRDCFCSPKYVYFNTLAGFVFFVPVEIMPTYAYRCKSCHHEFEELQKITDNPLVVCPSCNKPTLIRLIHGGVGVHFKGSGFYQTDYKKSGSSSDVARKSSKAETKKEAAAPETKGETKSEPKPAEKPKAGSGGEAGEKK